MVIAPLVFVTLVSGVVSMGDPSKLGSLGIKTLAMFMATTLAAIVIGLTIATVLQPGAGVDLSAAVPTALQAAIPLTEQLMRIVPENPFAALAEGDILAIIFFALLVGISPLVCSTVLPLGATINMDGTAAVPGASLFLMAAVMQTINLTPEQIAVVVGFELAFDRPLDMLRTSVNIGGDLSVATTIAKWENEFDQEIFDRPLKDQAALATG